MSNMSERDVAVLKEALFKQYIIMKKLFMELEEERNASATAASEALSMILRLQREKAAEKMEACQYKRMAEEKMYHAEECLMILEEVMQQKEIEISVLKHQLRAYKQKLLSIGLTDLEFGRRISHESLLSREDGALLGKTSIVGSIRRNISLPSLKSGKWPCEMETTSQGSPSLLSEQSIWRMIEAYKDQLIERQKENPNRSVGAGIDCYNSEEVTEMVKYELSSGSCANQATSSNSQILGEEWASSWHSTVSNTSFYSTCEDSKISPDREGALSLTSQGEDQSTLEPNELRVAFSPTNSQGKMSNSSCVLDIVEVPESGECCISSEPSKLSLENPISKTKSIMGTESAVPQETEDHIFRDNSDCLNDAFTYMSSRSNSPTQRTVSFTHQAFKFSFPRKDSFQNYTMDYEDERTTSKNDFEEIRSRLQQLEDENVVKMKDTELGNQQLKLLTEIYEQLNTIENRLNASTSKKWSPHEDSTIVSITEAVLSFSI